jgi:hypothetical protein
MWWALFGVGAVITIILLRFWYIILPLMVIYLFTPSQADRDAEARRHEYAHRGYNADTFTPDELAKAVTISVPVHILTDDPAYAMSGYPVTFGNHSTRAFKGHFYVVCTITQTVADGPGELVIGVKQYPYTMEAYVDLMPQSIVTVPFKQAFISTYTREQFENMTGCNLFESDSSAEAAANDIDDKWLQVTPYGANRTNNVDLQVPMSSNIENYKNPFVE